MKSEQTRETIQAERRRLAAIVPAWIEAMAAPGIPFGRFRFHAAQRQPWLLYASQQMLSLALDNGYWETLDPARKNEWLELLLSAQNPATGLFVCPVARAEDTPDPARWDSIGYYRAITLKLARRLTQLGIRPRHHLPRVQDVAPALEVLPAKLAALPWDDCAYGAASSAGHWAVTRLQELREDGAPLGSDPYVMRIVAFLESRQNPQTGFWGNSPSLEDGLNGMLKTLTIYEMLERPLPRPDRISDGILNAQRPDGSFGEQCTPWNALVLLTHLARHSAYRRADIQAAACRLVPALAHCRQPDGFYSSSRPGCLTVHAGVRLCARPEPIGDLPGIAQTLDILKMIEALGGWRTLPAQSPPSS